MSILYSPKYAVAIGTAAETFNITGSNDQLEITIDGGSPQTFSLTNGAARTAAQIVADCAALTGATINVAALPAGNVIRIFTNSNLGAASTIDIGNPADSAHTDLGLSLVQYVGYEPIYQTFIGTAKQDIIDGIEAALLAAGWTTVSGSGTTNLLMQSDVTPDNLQIRARIKDNTGNCATISIENVSGTKVGANTTSAGGMLLPGAAKTFNVLANRYSAYVFTAGSVSTAREFVMFGTVALPAHLSGVITECGYLQGNGLSDSSATLVDSFRTSLMSTRAANNSCANLELLVNGSLIQNNNNSFPSVTGSLHFTFYGNVHTNNNTVAGYRWHDDSGHLFAPILNWGLAAFTDEGKARGYLWDAVLSTESYVADQTVTLDSYDFWIITNSNTGSGTLSSPRGSLLVVVP